MQTIIYVKQTHNEREFQSLVEKCVKKSQNRTEPNDRIIDCNNDSILRASKAEVIVV